jgi:hypothetical protein
MQYASFCCSCCGYTNSDMFYDWLQGREPTTEELLDFKVAKRVFYETSYLKQFKQGFENLVFDRKLKDFRRKKSRSRD